MRDCRVCGQPKVATLRGPATCIDCRQAKYRVVKERYRQGAKGKATERAYEEREYVRERRRQFSRSLQGKRNQALYEATDKGKATRKKALAKYHASPKAKQASAAKHQRTKDDPQRTEQRRKANSRYRRTENGKALARRQNAQRRGAILGTENPLTAADWLEVLKANRYRCHYCKQKGKLTLDHVIPLSKGGQHTKENVVPACPSCNSKKRDRIIRLL